MAAKHLPTLSIFILSSEHGSAREEDDGSIYQSLLPDYSVQGEVSLQARLLDFVPSDGNYPMVVLLDGKSMYLRAWSPTVATDGCGGGLVNMYNMLVECGGLTLLAETVPSLYPYLWPSSLLLPPSSPRTSQPPSKDQCHTHPKSHMILNPPLVVPFRSLLVFGQCLHLEGFWEVLEDNSSITYLLVRLLLGEDVCARGERVGVVVAVAVHGWVIIMR